MNIFVLLALSVGLSMDAFAVSVCKGLSISKATLKKAMIVGLYFGVFQAGMPLIGYAVANRFATLITSFSHWIAFGLLCFLGIKMIIGSFKNDDSTGNKEPDDNEKQNETKEQDDNVNHTENSLGPKQMLPLAIATSIDAMAVGVSIAFLQDRILPIVISAGIATFILSTLGVKIGSLFGTRFKSKAELIGGIILILIGLNILLDNIGL